MFIKTFILIAVAASLVLGSPLNVRAGGSCSDTSQFEPVVTAGSPTAGTAFCDTDWGVGYKPITNVTVFWREYQVAGIQVTYSDGSQSPVHGSSNTQYHGSIGVDYALGERWTDWRMFASSQDGFAALRIFNSKGQVLRAGESQYDIDYDGLSAIRQPVGSGILFGTQGSTTNNLVSLRALFLSSDISSIEITDFDFPNGPTGRQNIGLDSLAQAHYYNNQETAPLSWTFQNSVAVDTTYALAQATANMYGGSETLTITIGIPMVASVSSATGFTWSTTFTTTNTFSIATTVTETWSETGMLQPGQGIDASALVGHGTGTYPYTSNVAITLKDGYKFSFEEDGELTIDDVSQAFVTTSTNNNPQ